MKHKISTYSDGYLTVSFCRVCAEENVSEGENCPGKPIPNVIKSLDNFIGTFDENGNLIVDKNSEPK